MGHDLDLLGSRDVTGHVTIRYSRSGVISYRCSIITDSVFPVVFAIMGPKDIGITTLPFLGHVTSSVICYVTNRFAICHYLLVSYWNRAFTAPVYEIFGRASAHIATYTDTRAPEVILADRTNGRAYATVLRLSVRVSVTLCIVAKRCVLEQKLLLRAYRKSYMRNRLVPK